MMRRLLAVPILLLALCSGAHAQLQRFGNEWIDYDAQYWTFKIGNDAPWTLNGIFRIDSTTLANAGLPLATLDARTIQLFAREQELAIHFPGDTDGVMNGTDVIEFFGSANDAWLDSALWEDPALMNTPYRCFANDTLRYYITFGQVPQGKRMEAYDASGFDGLGPSRTWLWASALNHPQTAYRKGSRDQLGTTRSDLGDGEGWFGNELYNNGANGFTALDYTLSTPNPYVGAGNEGAWFRTVSAGSNSASNLATLDHRIRITGGPGFQLIGDTTFTGYHTWKFNKNLTVGGMGPTSTVRFDLPHTLPGLAPDYPDRQVYGYARVDYPHERSLGGENGPWHFWVPNNGEDSAHIQFIYCPPGMILYVWGETMRRTTTVSVFQNGEHAAIPLMPGADSTHIFMHQAGQVTPISSIRPVTASGYFTDYAATEVDSAMVIITHPKLMTSATEYAQYRSTNPYNRYNTLLADVNELYDQFGGGIYRHPMAIRRFVGHLLDRFETEPQALFLIGKATQAPRVSNSESGYNSISGNDTLYRNNCMVPSWGYPCSDMMLTLGLSGDPWDMTVPVGRLAAINNDQVLAYLDKVQQLEAQEPAAWMKNILHFRGGLTPQDTLVLQAVLDTYRIAAEDTLFMGNVTTFRKTIDQNNQFGFADAQLVYDKIQEGVTLMTFAAHAFGGGFDFTIDQPENYNWNGKFPFIIGNSCYTGNIHGPQQISGSEQFVLPGNSGAIAYIASTDLGVANVLNLATTPYYRSFSLFNYGGPIGRHMQFMDSVNLVNNNGWPAMNAGIHQFTLHGDPTLVMNSPKDPDLEVLSSDVKLLPDPVTADVDSFQVQVIMRNIGRGTHTPFPVAAQRRMVEEGVELPPVLTMHSMQHWQDTVRLTLPVLADSGGVGNNEVEVRLDLDPGQPGALDEPVLNGLDHDEVNNRTTIPFLLTTGDILPVEPYNFAITPDATPTLKASTGDPFAPARNYVFQIDTIDTYDSPLLEQAVINAPGGVVSWMPPSIYSLNLTQDSTVFYWRCSIDSVGNDGYDWHEFSFQHIRGRAGWGQAHHMQFKPGPYNNAYSTLNHDRPGYDFDFDQGLNTISVQTLRNSSAISQWRKNLIPMEGGGCGSTSVIHMAVIDPLDFVQWQTVFNGVGHDLGASNNGLNPGCTPSYRAMNVFQFKCDNDPAPNGQVQLPNLNTALLNTIPDGHYILIYSYKSILPSQMQLASPQLLPTLGALGATQLANGTVPDGAAYVFFCQKGNDLYDSELWSMSYTVPIDTTFTLPSSGRAGNMFSPRTCEVLDWNSMHWQIDPDVPTDMAQIRLHTVSPDGIELPGYVQYPANTTDSLLFDTVGVNASLHPRLRLQGAYVSAPGAMPRPAQTKRWQIIASPAPECAIDPPSGFLNAIDSLYEGETARIMVAVRNISQVNMSNLLMQAWVTDQDNERILVHYKVCDPLPAGGILLDTISFDTTGIVGLNAITIEANGRDSITHEYHQREQYHFNNIATLRFRTFQDIQNPIVDVTFDGMHILDGDIVSARPEINISVDDENPVLLLDEIADTANVQIYLRRPGSSTEERLRFSGPSQVLEFIPADGPDNICGIRYNPVFTADGVYYLRIYATDESFNVSGSNSYTVRFEVITRPTITEVLNYPNPFTTSTRFVFTLTGSEVPTAMRIRIMTITGRVVREIGLDELGPLRVGRNVSEYAWDGRDQFGDKLARGVYLYQVVAQLNGEDIEYRETSAGGYFTKGFGKMYLLQ